MQDSQNRDELKLNTNPQIRKMLKKKGNINEKVLFSDFVVKINRKDKEQNRVLMITDLALYNILPNFSKCKRRILIKEISGVSISNKSDEFVVHVPNEYDYRYNSEAKLKVKEVLEDSFKNITKKKLRVNFCKEKELKDVTVTRTQAKLLSREERRKRLEELLKQEHESDKEDMDSKNNEVTKQILKTKTKVGLDDFTFLKVIGRGSFGKVMLVRKNDTGTIFAMKILKKNAILARNQVEHTRAERKILQSLQHPFLMHLRFAFQTKGKLYFVLDYLRGGELFFHLKNKRRFSEKEARFFIAEVGMALGHLHSLDVIYRDLKPENILLDEEGHLCLTDFGLSKDLSPDNPEAHTFCGTPEYLAPEIVVGCGHNKAVDWWSLGILLYELTVGIPPFYSQSVNEMYHLIQHGVLRFPPFLSDNCKDLIIKLLHRDPAERLGSSKADFKEIQSHAFFKGLDFKKLGERKIDPPFKPNIKSTNKSDTSMFDTQFTDEAPIDTFVPDSAIGSASEGAFDGFTFVDQSVLG